MNLSAGRRVVTPSPKEASLRRRVRDGDPNGLRTFRSNVRIKCWADLSGPSATVNYGKETHLVNCGRDLHFRIGTWIFCRPPLLAAFGEHGARGAGATGKN